MSESIIKSISNITNKIKSVINPTKKLASNTEKDGPINSPIVKGDVSYSSYGGKTIFILIAIIVFLLIISLGMFLINYWGSGTQNVPVYLISGISNGYTPTTLIQDPATNPNTYVLRSNNRDNGAEFTWSSWLYIKDIVGNGQNETFQNIFNKGNNQYDPITGIATINNGPGLYLSKGTNTLRVIMDTVAPNQNVASNYTDITNIPLGKWFHLAIRLQNRNLDTYVNGIIATRHYLIDVPKQNYDAIHVCQNGGFSGNYSDLFYYNYSLPVDEIQRLVIDGPGLNYSDVHIQTETSTLARSTIGNNYLSPLWYFNEKSSSSIGGSSVDLPRTFLSTASTGASTGTSEVAGAPQMLLQNGNLVPAILADNYDETGNLVQKGLIVKEEAKKEATVGTVQTAIADIIKAIPFSLNLQWLSTLFTDMMGGDVRALENHNVDCAGSAINSFQYINPGDGTFDYKYMCNNAKGGGMTDPVSNYTPFTDTTGSTLDLVNQKVQCPNNSVLSQFKLINTPPLANGAIVAGESSKIKYDYKCLQAPATQTQMDPLSCRKLSTPSVRMTPHSKFLSKTNITCDADEALSGFQYILSGDSYHYDYTCCKTPYSGGDSAGVDSGAIAVTA